MSRAQLTAVAPDAGWRDLLLRRLGGPLGVHADRVDTRLRGPGLLLLIATLNWLLLMMRQLSCRQSVVGEPINTFYRLCYSDIPVLYQNRGFGQGNVVYLNTPWEYPVLTGYFVELARRLTDLVGTTSGPGLTGQQVLDNANIFFAITAVMLYICFAVLVVLQQGMAPGHRWQAGLMVAASPVVLAEGLINWDLFAVMLTAAAMYAWSRRSPFVAGILFGLAIAAKLYPLFILGPLLLLLLRAAKFDAMSRLLAGGTASWLAVNLPVYLANPTGWWYFWTFNSDRGADLGSIWYVLQLAGIAIPGLNVVWVGLFVLGCAALGLLIMAAPRRPRVGQVAFLVIALFLILNKVYSPQYALWLLPLLVLARPVWKDWLVWTIAELAYFAAIWGHLAGTLHPGNGGPDRIYWLAVAFRVGVSIWLMVRVVSDILQPDEDPLRAGGGDDEIGGVLDHAPDVYHLSVVVEDQPTAADEVLHPDPQPAAEPDSASGQADSVHRRPGSASEADANGSEPRPPTPDAAARGDA